MTRGRRTVLSAVTGAVAGSMAGCLAEPERNKPGEEALYTSFFTLQEFTSAVADDRRVDTAVPVGEHGHGWEPPASLVPEIVDAAAFVYLGAEGFQHWVDDALSELESEYDDVPLIDALERIDPLRYDGDGHHHDHDERHDVEYDHDDREPSIQVRTIRLIDPDSGDEVADAHGDHWHRDPVHVPRDARRSFRLVFETDDGTTIDLDDEYALQIRIVHGDDGIVDTNVTEDTVGVTGRDDGFVRLAFLIVDDGEVAYETPPIEAEVGDHSHDVDDHDDAVDDHGHHHENGHERENGHGHSDHSHGEYDAKFFSDPVLAKRGVETIRDGLIDLDPANEAVYEENAAAYVDELESLHRSYEQRLAGRDHDAVVLAGHDSFRYLSERYGFEVHTPVGLSPDADVASDDLAEAVAFVEDRGIEYVLWDYFDGDRQANLIADAAETVEGTLMVSPAESTTQEWLDAGNGDYLGQMREINLPAFETALGAE